MDIFNYSDLTWPEVARLDRDTPLAVPVGQGVPVDFLRRHYHSERQVGLMPAIPFGWKGSLLDCGGDRLVRLLNDLADSVHTAGFRRLTFVLPEKIRLEGLPNQLHVNGWNGFGRQPVQTAETGKVLVLAIGHIEQHGFHLPLSTDTDCISAISEGIQRAAPGKTLCLPVFPYGVSMHHKSFAGTTTMAGETFEKFWIGIIDAACEQGYRKMYLINGHGGNHSFLVNVVKYAGNNHPDIFCATAYCYLSGPKGIQALEERRESQVGGMGHACELETSLMLAIKPDLVHVEKAVDEVDFISTPSYYQDWIEGGALIANPPWEDDTLTGAYGAGSLGTAEKGRYWLRIAIEEKIDHIDEISQQYERRAIKRSALRS